MTCRARRHWMILATVLMTTAVTDFATAADQPSDEEIWAGADARIEQCRKADATIVVVDAAGKPLPGAKIDGVNLLPYLKGEKTEPPHETLFWRFGQQSAVRKGQWKLVKVGGQPAQLYDLAADIGEAHNLAEQRPEIVKELETAWAQWNSQLEEPRWKQESPKPRSPTRKKAREKKN